MKKIKIFKNDFKDPDSFDLICSNLGVLESLIEKGNIETLIIETEFFRVIDNKDGVDWNYISKYQKLSEGFIKEFKDRIDWDYISEYQKLSESKSN